MRRFFEERRGEGERRRFRGNPHEESGSKRIALAPGFIIDSSGTIVTNNHVCRRGREVEVTLQDNSNTPRRSSAATHGTDPRRAEDQGGQRPAYVSFGDSSAAQVGDWVVAVATRSGWAVR